MIKLLLSATAAVALAGAVLVVGLSAQSGPAPAAPSSTDALLAEIKALRADLNQRLDATIRAQLLVARLQLQEQRIAALSRELSDIQQRLHANEFSRAPLEAQLKTFEDAQASSTEAEKKEANFFVDTLRKQVEMMTKGDEELKRQQLYVSGLMADEQSRWTAFNASLEELERLLTTTAPSRR